MTTGDTIQEQTAALAASIAGQLGKERVEAAVSRLRGLLDDEGLKCYLGIVQSFQSLDQALPLSLLSSGDAAFQAVAGRSVRTELLSFFSRMGKSKWSVVESLFRGLPRLKGRPDAVILGWAKIAGALADKDQDVALQ